MNELYQSVYDQIVVEKTAFKKKWDASILGRAEKKLEPLVKFSKSQFKTIDGSAAHRLKSSADVERCSKIERTRNSRGATKTKKKETKFKLYYYKVQYFNIIKGNVRYFKLEYTNLL